MRAAMGSIRMQSMGGRRLARYSRFCRPWTSCRRAKTIGSDSQSFPFDRGRTRRVGEVSTKSLSFPPDIVFPFFHSLTRTMR